MIIKKGMTVDGLRPYVRKKAVVHAKRMRQDFLYETGNGWHQGKRGDWLLLCDGLWEGVAHEQFLEIYQNVMPPECEGDCLTVKQRNEGMPP